MPFALRAKPESRSRTIPICVSSCGRWTVARAVISATIPLTDYFLPSLDDVRLVSGLDDPRRSSIGAIGKARGPWS